MCKKPTHVAWLPLLLILALALLLGACSTTGSISSSQAPVVPTSSPQSSTSTPSITPSASPVSSKPALPLTAIRMVDTKNGWALTASSILKTTDGGLHWNDVTPANAGLNPSARGQFMNTQDAWIAIGPANQQEGPGIAVLRTHRWGLRQAISVLVGIIRFHLLLSRTMVDRHGKPHRYRICWAGT